MEYTTFFIKPNWMMPTLVRSQILKRIEVFGMQIVLRKEIELTLEILEKLYERHTSTEGHEAYWQAVWNDLCGKMVVAGIVAGDDAIGRLVAVTGDHTSPKTCASGTIRNTFGSQVEPVQCGKLRYWSNVIHRAKSAEEVVRDLKLFFPEWQQPQSRISR